MKYLWRKKIDGAAYAHADIGDDHTGDGTQEKPFQSLRKCLSLNPTIIVCFGTFTEDMADGNHTRTIEGDYHGAATFDGDDIFIIYGYTHKDFFVKNTIVGNTQLSVAAGSRLLAGVGRALHAGIVGLASNVYGAAGSPVFIEKAGLYWGVIGGITACRNNVYSKIRSNETHPISIGFRDGNIDNLTVYDVPIERRQKRITTQIGSVRYGIFSKFDFIADDVGVGFSNCLILADCRFFFNGVQISITGSTSVEREASLLAGMDSAGVPVESRSAFVNCIFSSQTGAEVFNNPEKSDFTIKPGSDGDLDIRLGAMPVAINVPILDNSNGVIHCWDENTAKGCVTVMGDAIRLDEYSAELRGSISTKIFKINPLITSLTGMFGSFSSKFSSLHYRLNKNNAIKQSYTQGQTLPVGKYIVEGGVTITAGQYGDNDVVFIATTGSSFTDVVSGSMMHLLDDYNYDVLYLRETSKIGAKVTATDALQRGGVYYNYGPENITYNGRTIVPGESFEALANDNFTSTPGYEVAVIFDDTRVPDVPWIPVQMFGEYFEWRNSADVRLDNRGIPISSGNDLSYQPSADGGYSDVLVKHPMTKSYFQIALFLNRFRS